MSRVVLLALIVATLAIPMLHAQPGTTPPAGGAVAPVPRGPRLSTPFQTYRLRDWMGRRVRFLELSQLSLYYGYREFHPSSDSISARQQYDTLVHRVGTVVEISKTAPLKLAVRLDDNGSVVIGTVIVRTLAGLTLVEELDSARARYKGRTLWMKASYLDCPDTKNGTSFLMTKVGTPVTVVDVAPGGDEHSPLRFVVRFDDGRQGAVDLHISNSNVDGLLQQHSRFYSTFSDVDPKVVRKWPKDIRKAIADTMVVEGMTTEQLRLSWGVPEEVYEVKDRPGAELWVYARAPELIIEKNVVTEVRTGTR